MQNRYLPGLIIGILVLAMLVYGPISRLSHYHEFADQSLIWGVPHANDVLSNLSFLLASMLGFLQWTKSQKTAADYAYLGFSFCLLLTAIGSSYYHWAPDDARLFWDRLPIALACTMLIAAVRFEHAAPASTRAVLATLCLWCALAFLSVVYWKCIGDLRIYLALQVAAIVLIPIWHYVYPTQSTLRRAYFIAIILYVLAKLCELADAAILDFLSVISGHSLKHLLAAMSGACILIGVGRSKNAT
jgi:hypothetical protein